MACERLWAGSNNWLFLGERAGFRATWCSFLVSVQKRYYAGMAKSKVAVKLSVGPLARVQRKIQVGRADSPSRCAALALEAEKGESLRAVLRDLTEQHGEPAGEDLEWADRALAARRG